MQNRLDPALARAVNQYLSRTGLTALSDAFQDECESRNISLKKVEKVSKIPESNDLKKRLLQSIEKNDKSRFFRYFSETFPNITESIAALEFQFQVYFATSPLRKTPPDRVEYRERVQELKTYLEEGNGARMAKNTELLPYFALPYVSDPMKHPVFKELLSKKHAKHLQDTLLRFMSKNLHSTTNSESESDEELKILSWKNAYDNQKQISPKFDKFRVQDYQDLQEDYYKIIEIASELIDCLEQTCSGKTIAPDLFAEISNRLVDSNYEAERRMQKSAMAMNHAIPSSSIVSASVTKRNRSLNNNRNTPSSTTTNQQLFPRRSEAIKKAELTGNLIPADPKARTSPPHHTRLPTVIPNNSSNSNIPTAFIIPKVSPKSLIAQLNFAKISNQLIKNPGTRSSALLLQALRLQLTKKRVIAEALPTLIIFAEKDILLLKNKKNSVVATIVAQSESSSETKEELARFLNAISSFKRGRDYLLSIFGGKELLYHLALALRTKKLIGYSAEHTVATLEKLSVRSSVQKELVLSGMIEWTLIFLENPPSSFGYEYGIALLANLFLHSVSSSTIFRYKDKVLALLMKLLESTNLQLISFAANAMYTLFTFAKMRSAAKEIKFEQQIEKCLQRIEGTDVENQLIVINRILHGEFDPQHQQHQKRQQQVHDSSGGGGNVDDETFEDYIEAEIDSTDTLIPTMTELFGEMLITKKYSLQQATLSTTTAINDDIAPPGTVPRRHHYNSSQAPTAMAATATGKVPKVTPRKGGGGGMTGIMPKQKQQQARESVPPVPLPPSTPPDQRMSSVASYATFIAENDRRKPLLGNTGLKAATNALKHQKKIINRLKDVAPPPPLLPLPPQPPPPPQQHPAENETYRAPKKTHDMKLPIVDSLPPKYRSRRKSESYLDEDDAAEPSSSLIKATSTSILTENISAPVVGKQQFRIPEDANVNEYVAAFGSRPKVVRTPEAGGKPKPIVFMY